MSLIVNHNLMAMTANRNLNSVYGRLSNSVARLSSGLRVNSAADDAAGLAIREQMRADIAVINQGLRNAGDAISMIQTAEGAMSVIDEKLTRMKELAEQAATGTYTTAQRLIMDSEYQAMAKEIDRIANATDFNGVKLLDGSMQYLHDGDGLKVHFGTGNDRKEDYYFINVGDMRASTRTGLQIGGGENYWQTTGLDGATAGEQVTNTGFFGIEVSTNDLDPLRDPDLERAFSMYGFIEVESGDSIQDIADKINQGRHATGSLDFTNMDGTTVAGKSFDIGSYTITFAGGTTTALSGNTLTVALGTTGAISASSVAEYTAAALNSVALTTVGVYGAADGATLQLMAYDGGTGGNLVELNVNAATISGQTTVGVTASGDTLSNGAGAGALNLYAEAYLDRATNEWELRISGYGDTSVRVFAQGATFTGVGTILDSSGSTTPNVWASGALTGTAGTSLLSAWSDGDESSEWSLDDADWNGQSIKTQSGAQMALSAADQAIATKDTARAALGALQNRLENTMTNLTIQAENLQAAESQISDADIASEMTEFTRNNILAQAAVAMLAQANSLPMLALSLLG